MSFPYRKLPMRRVSLLGAAAFLAVSFVTAQSPENQGNASSFSPSTESRSPQMIASLDAGGSSPTLPAAPAPTSAAVGSQYGNSGESRGFLHNRSWAFEAGAGFNAPIGNDSPYITWGGNFTLGGGLRFSDRYSALLEYQFMDDKLPGAFLANEGVQAGNAHINAITGSAVIDLFPKRTNGAYLVGGWGLYHKSTNFNDYSQGYGYGYGYGSGGTVTVASVTSNQWGGNAGFGIYHRLGAMYGDSHSELFAETRYTFIHTPPITQSNGLGTTELIPVTLGIRF